MTIKILILTFFSSIAFAKPFFYDWNVGLMYSSLMESRGVILYDDFQLTPVIAFNIYNDHLSFAGNALEYKNELIEHVLQYRGRIYPNSDQPFFPARQRTINRFHHRPTSLENSHRLEYYFVNNTDNYKGSLALEYDLDLNSYHGNTIKIESLLKFATLKKTELNVYISLGAGDLKNNQYWYGNTSAPFSLNHFETGINLLLPEEVDRFYPVIQIHYFTVLGNENKMATWSHHHSHGVQLQTGYTYSIP